MDMEKVIKALDLCSNALYCADPYSRCGQCPYRTKDMTGTNEMNCSDVLMADALALLKEQIMKLESIVSFENGDRVIARNCPFCGSEYRIILKGPSASGAKTEE